ncbi:MAG: TetR/AcrR family transcriptional regulator, partial [Pseudomonadota bacterium]
MEDDRHTIIAAFETTVAEKGWLSLDAADLAESSGVSLARVRALFPRKIDLLDGLARAIDEEVLDEGLAEADEPARDRLFEIMMRRMDALQDRRPTIEALLRDLPRDPAAGAYRALSVPTSMSWMLRAARIDARGIEGLIKARVLAALYGWVLRTWQTDDTDDMAPTMKALDERLKLAE